VAADIEASGSPWRSGRHYVLGRPAAAHTIVPGVRAISLRDPAAVVAGREPG